MNEPWKTRGPDFNAWNEDFDRFSALLLSAADEPWWIVDFDLKYLNIRLDTRDNGFLLLSDEKDGKRERISPDRIVAAIEKYRDRFKSRRSPSPSPNLRMDVDRLAASIATAACELDGPADPAGDDTISITMKDLEAVVHRHVTAALEACHD